MASLEELSQQVESLNFQVSDMTEQMKNLDLQVSDMMGQMKNLQLEIDVLKRGGGSSGSSGGGGVSIDQINTINERLAKLSALSNLDSYEQAKNSNSISVSQTTFYIDKSNPKTVYYERSNLEMAQIVLESFPSQPSSSDSSIVYYLDVNPSMAFVLPVGSWSSLEGKSFFIER